MSQIAPRTWKTSFAALEGQISDQRKRLGLTQTDIARKLLISRSKMQRFDRGDPVLSAFELFRLADMLGVDITSTIRTDGVSSDAAQVAA